ncbi:MAG: extracellular solute-binding protein [Clostridia bacterium]|nr:extracellular solute-binding protein [Clostridia bacterium]
MKKIKKVLALTMALGLIATSTACGGSKNADTLIIEAFDGGYGVQWLYDIVDAYKAANPDKKVEIKNTTPYDEGFETALSSGATTTDLYFGRESMRKYMMSNTVINGQTYDSLLANLTDVYTGNVPGEDIKVEDKFIAESLQNAYVEDDEGNKSYFTMPWIGGAGGIIYNKKVWKDTWEVPNTTDELLEICQTIKTDGYTPMIYCLQDSYWYFPCEIWFAQYEGKTSVDAFWNGYDENGERYTPEILLTKGLLKSYEVVESLLQDSKGFMDARSKTDDFTTVQTHFLATDSKIAMIPNGDWIQREMSANYSEDEVDIGFLKTPVISSIVETLEYRNGTEYMSDETLSAVIAAIDSGATSYDGVSAADFARLQEARSIYTGFCGHVAWVPAYSSKVDLAKDFLRYMTTDESIRIFTKATNGYTQPFHFDYTTDAETSPYMKNFMLNSYELQRTGTFVARNAATDRLFCVGGVKMYGNSGNFETYFSASNSADYLSAYDYYEAEYNFVKSRWSNYLQLAGIGV